MNPDFLRYFVAFAETGSLHAAARQVGRSPAALSKALGQLQSILGRTLVVPHGRGLAVTADGRAFLDRTKEVLRAFDTLWMPPAPSRRTLRVGTFEVFSTHVAPELFTFEGSLELRELGPGALEHALVEGQIDIGLTYSPVPTRGVIAREVGRVSMKIFARKGSFRGLSSAQLPFVAPLATLGKSPTRIQGLDGWPVERPRKVVAWVTLLESALALLRSGRCVAYLPELVVRRHNAIVLPRYHLAPVAGTDRIPHAEKTRAFLLRRDGEPPSAEALALELRLKRALA